MTSTENLAATLANLRPAVETARDAFASLAVAGLNPRHAIVLDAYQRLASFAIPAVEVDEHGDRWGVAVYLDDMWPMIVEEINGRDEVLAVVLDLAARTEGEFSSVMTDEFGETRIVFEAGILGC